MPQLLLLLSLPNTNLLATYPKNNYIHPEYYANNIERVQFLVVDAIASWFLAGTNKCQQLRSFWWGCLPPTQGDFHKHFTLICGFLASIPKPFLL
jgi:hypothetical protein